MAYHRTTAIVLRCTDFSETSQVVAMITPDLGQVHALAKGARRPRKDGRMPLDLLNHCDVVLSLRPAGRLHLLAEWTVRDHFTRLRGDLRSLWCACQAAELALRTTSENPDDGTLAEALLDLLCRLEEGQAPELTLCRFLARALLALGNAPIADRCAQCGHSLDGPTRFSPSAGGALCGDCGAVDPQSFSLSRGACAVMHRLEADAGMIDRLRISAEQAHEIRRAFTEQIQYHLGYPLRTERFLKNLFRT